MDFDRMKKTENMSGYFRLEPEKSCSRILERSVERAGNGKPFSVKQPGNDRHPAGQDTAESANMVHGRTRKGQGPDSVPALSPGSLCRVKSVDPFDFMLDIQ